MIGDIDLLFGHIEIENEPCIHVYSPFHSMMKPILFALSFFKFQYKDIYICNNLMITDRWLIIF